MGFAAQEFDTFGRWVDMASTWLTERGPGTRAVCVDAMGRRCRIGRDFARARDEGAFPVRWFWPEQLALANLDCIVSDVLRGPAADVPAPERPDPVSAALTTWLLSSAAAAEARDA